jgi:hypothetical protein
MSGYNQTVDPVVVVTGVPAAVLVMATARSIVAAELRGHRLRQVSSIDSPVGPSDPAISLPTVDIRDIRQNALLDFWLEKRGKLLTCLRAISLVHRKKAGLSAARGGMAISILLMRFVLCVAPTSHVALTAPAGC